MLASKIKIGPAGWDYPDWQGIVYPARPPKGFSRLALIASFFDIVEVNTSFYQPPKAKTVASWLDQVQGNPRFCFTAKLWQKFTHSDTPIDPADRAVFLASLQPLLAAQKLAAVLVQFPWRFKNNDSSQQRLQQILAAFSELPLVAEFRHESWLSDSIYQLLRAHKVGIANIDQPVIGKSIPPGQLLTTSTGYVRFHGRNYDSWFASDSNRNQRYNYLYNQNELAEWSARIKTMAAAGEAVYIIFNNHYRGQAVANGFQMMADLYEEAPLVPESILANYPLLQSIARPRPARPPAQYSQGELF